jgi:hypothetical protein
LKTNVWRAAVPVLLLACLFGSVRTCYGQTDEAKSGWKKKWIIAAVALTAANIFDAYSSRGGHELNPLLRGVDGRFSPRRAILVKSVASGGGLLLQAILIKKMPDQNLYRPFAIATAAAAGLTAVTASCNYTVSPAIAPAYLMRRGNEPAASAPNSESLSTSFHPSLLLRQGAIH